MSNSRFMTLVGAAGLALFAAFYLWQTPGSKLSPDEIERYVAKLERLPMPPEEKPGALARVRAWAQADDGQPFYMLNLMRYFRELRRYPGTPAFSGTPREANAHYEAIAKNLLLKSGSYPIIGGETLGRDILEAPPELDNWDRVLVVRYRNRRAFLDLLTDPEYAPVMPYKLMALSVVLVPVSGDLVIPDVRWIAGGFLLSGFLAIGWIRSASARRELTSQ